MNHEHDDQNAARSMRRSVQSIDGVGQSPGGEDDERVKSDEAALRRVATAGGVGAFAVAQPAAGGRRGPRIRRSASARRRARERAGLEPAGREEAGDGNTGGGDERDRPMNPDELIAADVEMQELNGEDEVDETLGFWELDRTDKVICGSIFCLVIALVVILVLAMT